MLKNPLVFASKRNGQITWLHDSTWGCDKSQDVASQVIW